MKIVNIGQLIDKFHAGECTAEEEQMLKGWLHQHNMEGSNGLTDDYLFDARINMLEAIDAARFAKVKKVSLWPRIAVAASVALAVSIGGYFFSYKPQSKIQEPPVLVNDKAPGKQGATLTLANGREIRLNNTLNGVLAKEAGVVITKSANGQLVYEIKGSEKELNKINTLSTEKGETYQVRLPDGSSVYLNAASSLTYSASLIEHGKRTVRLRGEAYFEIFKDKKHPFIVKTDKQEVEVLGTHFNVSAYKGEELKTTLLEGSVKIVAVESIGAMKIILEPGEQARLSSEGLSVENVNPEYAVAWTKGYFLFNNETLEEAMLKIGRWYNVKVVYDEPALKHETLFGTISRFGNISGVFKMIERADVVRFSIEGNIVHVKRKKSD